MTICLGHFPCASSCAFTAYYALCVTAEAIKPGRPRAPDERFRRIHRPLNIREQIARIDRFLDEAAKFRSERSKLDAEAAKLNRDRFLAPALALAATLGAIAAFAPAIMRAIGGHG